MINIIRTIEQKDNDLIKYRVFLFLPQNILFLDLVICFKPIGHSLPQNGSCMVSRLVPPTRLVLLTTIICIEAFEIEFM